MFVVIKLRPPTTTATEGEGGANGGTAENDNKEPTEIEARHVDSETGMVSVHAIRILVELDRLFLTNL